MTSGFASEDVSSPVADIWELTGHIAARHTKGDLDSGMALGLLLRSLGCLAMREMPLGALR